MFDAGCSVVNVNTDGWLTFQFPSLAFLTSFHRSINIASMTYIAVVSGFTEKTSLLSSGAASPEPSGLEAKSTVM